MTGEGRGGEGRGGEGGGKGKEYEISNTQGTKRKFQTRYTYIQASRDLKCRSS